MTKDSHVGKVILGMTMPLDGFIKDHNGSLRHSIPTLLFGGSPKRTT